MKGNRNLQRKMSRQRDIEHMEDAAAGVAPTMEISSALTEGEGGIFLRPRSGNAAPESEIPQPTASSSAPKNKDLWKRTDTANQENLNLYDPSSAAYQDNTPSFSKRVLGLFSGGSRKKTEHHDASPAEPADYVGDYPRKGFTKTLNPFCHPIYKTFCSTKSRCFATLLAIILLPLMGIVLFKEGSEVVEETSYNRFHTERFNQIYERLVLAGVSHDSDFDDYFSAQYHALRWLAHSDPAELPVDSPFLEQRYALAVFYYESYLTFQFGHGRQPEVARLEDHFYEGVPNPGWIRKDYWLSAHGYCSWYGVDCEPEDEANNITHYEGAGNVLGFSLPANEVTATIPREFKVFHKMETLDLAKNYLRGTFPQDLAFNFNLKQLILGDNELTGSIVSQVRYLEGVQEIDMSNNRLQGIIPTELNLLPRLSSLHLGSNFLTGMVPNLANCPLTSLSVSHNNLAGSFPASLTALTRLQDIHMDHNKFTGSLPRQLTSLSNLAVLRVNGNIIGGTIPNEISSLANLRDLDLKNNTFTGTIPASLVNCDNLEKLQLDSNGLSGSVENICNLKSSGQLSLLTVDCNAVSCSCCDNCGGGVPLTRRLQEAFTELFTEVSEYLWDE